jgi:excisionase family DNA binding protein
VSVSSARLGNSEFDGGSPLKPLAVSVKTARQLLDIGNSKMWELISEGRVETVRLGRKRLVLYHSLEALLNSAAR